MLVELAYLDNFWCLSKSDTKVRKQAIERIVNDLQFTYKEKQDVYLKYTIERLVKGLASIHQTNLSSEEIISMSSKHLYTLKTSSEKEEKALRLGFIYMIEVLVESSLTPKLSVGEIDAITNPLIKFLDSKRIGHLVAINFIKTTHFVPKMLEELLRFELSERVSAARIILLLKIYDKHKTNFLQAGIKPIKLNDKNLKIFAHSLLAAHELIVLESIEYLVNKGLFEQFWTIFSKLVQSTSTDKDYTTNARRMFECLLKALPLATSYCFFNEHVISMFLENRQEHSKLFKVIAWFLNSLRTLPESVKPLLSSSLLQLMTKYPMLDVQVQKNQNRVIIRLVEWMGEHVDSVTICKWAASLFQCFLKGSKIGGFEGLASDADGDWTRMRLSILNCIRVAMQACVASNSTNDQFFDLCKFLVMVALAAKVSPLSDSDCCKPITTKESQTSWTCLFAVFCNSKLKCTLQFLSKIITLILQCLPKELEEKFSPLKQLFDDLSDVSALKLDSNDLFHKLQADLHSFQLVLLLYAIYDATVSEAKNEGILALVQDIGDCVRIANLSKGLDKYKKPKKTDQDPQWQLVLVDGLVNSLSYPNHLIRSFALRCFKTLLSAANASDKVSDFDHNTMVGLIVEVLQQRAQPASGKKEDDVESDEDEEDLMQFDELEPRTKKRKFHADEDDEQEEEEEDSSDEMEEEEEETPDLNMREKLARIVDNPFLAPSGEEATAEDMKRLDEALEQVFGKDEEDADDDKGTNSAIRKMANQARELRQLKMKLLDFLAAIIKNCKMASVVLFCLRSLFLVAEQSQQAELKLAKNKKQSSLKLTAKYEDMVPCSALRALLQTSLHKAHLLNLAKSTDSEPEILPLTQYVLDQLSRQRKFEPEFIQITTSIVAFLLNLALKEEKVNGLLYSAFEKLLAETRLQSCLHEFFVRLFTHIQKYSSKIMSALNKKLREDNESLGQFKVVQLYRLYSGLFQAILSSESKAAQVETASIKEFIELTGKILQARVETASVSMVESIVESVKFCCQLCTERQKDCSPLMELLQERILQPMEKKKLSKMNKKLLQQFRNRFAQLSNSNQMIRKDKAALKQAQKDERRAKRKERQERFRLRQQAEKLEQKEAEPMEVEAVEEVTEKKPVVKTREEIELKKMRREQFRKHKLDHIKKVNQTGQTLQDKKLAKIKNKHRKNILAKTRC